MKKYVSLAALLLALPTMAHAQEATSFQGFYAGLEGGVDNYELSAGLDLGDLDPTLAGGSAVIDGLSADGVAGGAFAGYQYGFGAGFVAVEGFARLSTAKMTAYFDDGVDSLLVKAEAEESYGIAARAGVKVANSTAVYGRVGWINTKFKLTLDDGIDALTASQTEDAIQYGVGVETMVGPKTSLRVEYTMADYGDAGLAEGLNLDSGSLSAGVAYRF